MASRKTKKKASRRDGAQGLGEAFGRMDPSRKPRRRPDESALADMFAALSAASHRGAVKDWQACRVQLRAATVLAPDERLREAIEVIFEHVGAIK